MGSNGNGFIEVRSTHDGDWVFESEIDFLNTRGYPFWCYLFGVRCDKDDDRDGLFGNNHYPMGSAVGKSREIIDDINISDTYGPYYFEYKDIAKIDFNKFCFDEGYEIYYPFGKVFDEMRSLSKCFNNVRAVMWFD